MEREKMRVSVVVAGDINAGKSTTIGHLMHKCGQWDASTMQEYHRMATNIYGIHQANFHQYSIAVAKLKAEIDRGMTIEAHRWAVETRNYKIALIDTPGHRDFIKNIITGVSHADCVVFVVDCTGARFDVGMGRNGQLRECILLAYVMGVKQIIVAMNKFDVPNLNYSEDRYEDMKRQLASYIGKVGYDPRKVNFIPYSAGTGENLVEKSPNMQWYEGMTLLEAIDAIEPPKRLADRPLRLPISDVYKIGGIGMVPAGRIATGVIRPRMLVHFSPGEIEAEVMSVEIDGKAVSEGTAGDIIGFNIHNYSPGFFHRGFVVSDANREPARQVSWFLAQVIILDHPGQISNGYTPILHCHTAHIACKFDEIESKIDRRSGTVIEKNPKFVKAGDACMVKMIPSKPLCVETYIDFPPLGRFVLRDLHRIVAIGVIRAVSKLPEWKYTPNPKAAAKKK